MFIRTLTRAALAVLAALSFSGPARAAYVEYSTTSLGGNLWRYDYTIKNDSPTLTFDEVTIHFSTGTFDNLNILTVPVGWDGIVVQPGLPWWSGFVDFLNLDGPLAFGQTVSGLSVTAQYLGKGAPGSQPFELMDSTTYTSQGWAWSAQRVAAVPEPATVTLVLLGCVLFVVARRRST